MAITLTKACFQKGLLLPALTSLGRYDTEQGRTVQPMMLGQLFRQLHHQLHLLLSLILRVVALCLRKLDTADAGSSGLHQETLSSPSFLYGSFYLLGQDCNRRVDCSPACRLLWLSLTQPPSFRQQGTRTMRNASRPLFRCAPNPGNRRHCTWQCQFGRFAGVLVAFDLSGIDGGGL